MSKHLPQNQFQLISETKLDEPKQDQTIKKL